MVTVCVIARFEAKPGTQAEMERFCRSGLSIVEEQLSVSLQAVTFGLSICRQKLRRVVNTRALRREHTLTTSLGRHLPMPPFRSFQLA